VSSVAHSRGRLDVDDLQGERHYDGYDAYARSKLCNVLFARALARRLAGTGVTVNALHPGVVTTKLLREGFGSTGISVEEGAAGSVRLATAPELEGTTGRYFSRLRETEPSATASDDRLAERLWEVSERMVAPFATP
jgi:NAD(P)-dependent dehydrogenase (short-subunit alcohol dehydrogenase family)